MKTDTPDPLPVAGVPPLRDGASARCQVGEGGKGTPVATARRRIFRQAALERLSTPEQLDQLVVLTGRGTRAAALVLWLLLAGVMAWGWLGVIPDYATAEGLLVSQGGAVVDVTASSPGRVMHLRVALGETVVPGQVLADLDRTELSQDHRHAQEYLAEQRDRLAALDAEFAEEREIAETLRRQRRESLTRERDSAVERREYLKTSLENLDSLATRGLSTREAVADTRQRYYDADRQVREAETDILRLDEEAFALRERQARERRDVEQAVSAARREVDSMALTLSRSSEVTAPAAGRVTEIKAPVGAFVERGQPVASVETGAGGLEAVVFLPPVHGKNVRAGQPVRLLPVNLKKEEVGAIEGVVLSVSPFPVTPEGMRAVLRNEDLVSQFSLQGAPYLAHVALTTDPGTQSGLTWTSGAGPDFPVGAGTVVSSEITVRERIPASLVMPFLRKHTGLGY